MMHEYILGGFAVSKAGHDLNKCYVIIQTDQEYVYLVDGRIRTLTHPKKKKKKHVEMLEQSDQTLAERVKNKTVRDEEIKRAIKLLQKGISGKEAH